jgi:hypothetical protein
MQTRNRKLSIYVSFPIPILIIFLPPFLVPALSAFRFPLSFVSLVFDVFSRCGDVRVCLMASTTRQGAPLPSQHQYDQDRANTHQLKQESLLMFPFPESTPV